MSKYRDAVLARKGQGVGVDCFTEEVRLCFPEVVALLSGEKNDKGHWDPSPASITIFYQDGRLKACVNPKHDLIIAFTTFETAEAILEALEAHFSKADLEWQDQKRGR